MATDVGESHSCRVGPDGVGHSTGESTRPCPDQGSCRSGFQGPTRDHASKISRSGRSTDQPLDTWACRSSSPCAARSTQPRRPPRLCQRHGPGCRVGCWPQGATGEAPSPAPIGSVPMYGARPPAGGRATSAGLRIFRHASPMAEQAPAHGLHPGSAPASAFGWAKAGS
jgi:hypothetical protein